MSRPRRRRVTVIGTGGSISVHGRHSLDLVEYGAFGPVLEVDELLARVPEVSDVAEITPVRFRTIVSNRIRQRDWLDLNELIHEVVHTQSPDGVVVTHGTATLEETAYFLNLTLKVDVPVVLVGAQRPTTGLSSDAHMNLLAAVRVAANVRCRGLGVLTLLNDEIQAAREVTKGSTFRLEAFRSPDVGMLGYVDPDTEVVLYRKPLRRHAPHTEFDVRGRDSLPRVDIVYSYVGADGVAIRALVEAGAQGIVSAGFAPGLMNDEQLEAVELARRHGVVVVQSCRAGSGRVIIWTKHRDAGIISADNLSPQKARILAMLGLTVTSNPARIQTFFNNY